MSELSPINFRAGAGKPCPVCNAETKGCARTEDGLHLCRGADRSLNGYRFMGAAKGDNQFNLFKLDARDKERAKPGAGVETHYYYHDENGKTLLRVTRIDPGRNARGEKKKKRFFQSRPDPSGQGWIENAQGVRLVPYRLPELLASPTEAPVFIVEGEKCVQVLVMHGLTATTNPGGAGKWKHLHPGTVAKAFAGRKVVILADNDDKGRSHAAEVASGLRGIASGMRIPELRGLPEKGDVVNWLEAGHTVAELMTLVENTPACEPSEGAATAAAASTGSAEVPMNYRMRDGGTYRLVRNTDGEVEIPLANFECRILAETTIDDGVEIKRAFQVEGNGPDGRKYPRVTVEAGRWHAMNWVLEEWGSRAIILPGTLNREHLRVAIQQSSDPASCVVFGHTGWREINGEWKYLHNAGAIGPGGNDPTVECRLPRTLAQFRLPDPPVGGALVHSVRSVLNLMDGEIAAEVLWSLFSAAFRAPLGEADFGIWLTGESGTRKSELAAIMMQFFGTGFDRRHLPGSWMSTANSLEGLLFALKDTLGVIDDFAPDGNRADYQKALANAARIVRAQGNTQGRGRMNADSTLRPDRPPRGLLLSTAETRLPGLSVRARLVVIETTRETVPTEGGWSAALAEAQHMGNDGVLAGVMSAYLQWLAARRQRGLPLLVVADEEMRQYQAPGGHGRNAGNISQLALGLRMFFDFALETGVMTTEEHGQRMARSKDLLQILSRRQIDHVGEADPAIRFLELVRSVLIQGKGHLADRDSGGSPVNADRHGWRKTRTNPEEWAVPPASPQLGWTDGKMVWIDPTAVIGAVNALAAQTETSLNMDPGTLARRLNDAGVLAKTEKRGGKNRFKVRVTIGGAPREVFVISSDTLFGRSEPMSSVPEDNGEVFPELE